MFKAVIYDLDDTLIDSFPLYEKAWLKLNTIYGIRIDQIHKEGLKKFAGMRVRDIIDEVILYYNLNIDADKIFNQLNLILFKLVKKDLELMPGVTSSLEIFKNRGYKIALASSGIKSYISLVIQKFSLEQYFDVIVYGDEVKMGKPNPETYLIAANKLGFEPSECLVLEDSDKGIQSAKTAGCSCIAVINPNTKPKDLSLADKIIFSLNEIN